VPPSRCSTGVYSPNGSMWYSVGSQPHWLSLSFSLSGLLAQQVAASQPAHSSTTPSLAATGAQRDCYQSCTLQSAAPASKQPTKRRRLFAMQDVHQLRQPRLCDSRVGKRHLPHREPTSDSACLYHPSLTLSLSHSLSIACIPPAALRHARTAL
jgi:hypothetical protein